MLVIEDDPQSGWDHVDGHRSICLVVSPYTKRHQTVSSFYSHTGVLHTMEQMLGLPPMNQMDAMAQLMTDCFTTSPDFTAYTARANNVPLDSLIEGDYQEYCRLPRKTRYWAEKSMKMDFSGPDRADDKVLNRFEWHWVRGNEPYPSKYEGAHGKGLKKLGLVILAKNQKERDDD